MAAWNLVNIGSGYGSIHHQVLTNRSVEYAR